MKKKIFIHRLILLKVKSLNGRNYFETDKGYYIYQGQYLFKIKMMSDNENNFFQKIL